MSDQRSSGSRPAGTSTSRSRTAASTPSLSALRDRGARALRLGAIAACLLTTGLAALVPSARAGTTGMVDLGSAASYSALSGASVGNTVSAPGDPHTTLRGDLAVKANTQPTGFPPGVVTGTINVGNAAASLAHADAVAAYDAIAARSGGQALAGALAGTTIQPGLYTITGAASNTTTVTLDGLNDPSSVFVFQVGGALTTGASSHFVLINGARASRVFWQVNGAAGLGANGDFAGTLIALDALAVGHGTLVNGRAFARNGALTLDDNQFYSVPPVVTITGGASFSTPDTTPTISGTTDVEAPATVTVTINGATLSAIPSGGAWSVTSAILANATYPVVASVTDAAGNAASATQQLTVDTVPPVVTLDGGSSVTTNDSTPTIGGTSDVAPGQVVQVAVGLQTLTALVQSGGRWNVTPSTLADGTVTVTASVTDPAGNPGTATQTLIVDTTAPSLVIAGGATALTNAASPTISGTAGVPPGTTVTVDLADETLSGVVGGGGAWSVTASALADGPHRVVVRVADPAGNPTSATQTLTVDTVAPVVTIRGGATATTSNPDPTIVGASNAAPGTIVTVSISDQTMTTVLQPDGSWNATPATPLADATWTVTAAAPDPAGNVGTAAQALTIASTPPPVPGGTGGGTRPPDPTPTPTGGTTPDPTGTGGGTTTPAPTAPPATTPPPSTTPAPPATPVPPVALAAVALTAKQKLKGSPLSLVTRVTAPAAGRLVVTATGTVRIKGVGRTIALTRPKASVAAGRTTALRLGLAGTKTAVAAALAKIRGAIAAGKSVTATVTLTIVDAAGHARTVKRLVKLT